MKAQRTAFIILDGKMGEGGSTPHCIRVRVKILYSLGSSEVIGRDGGGDTGAETKMGF